MCHRRGAELTHWRMMRRPNAISAHEYNALFVGAKASQAVPIKTTLKNTRLFAERVCSNFHLAAVEINDIGESRCRQIS